MLISVFHYDQGMFGGNPSEKYDRKQLFFGKKTWILSSIKVLRK